MSRNAAVALVAVFAGCVTAYGPSAKSLAGGYDEERLGDGRWWLEVRGNGLTSRTTLARYFHRRATELCGGDYEAVSDTEEETSPGDVTLDADYLGRLRARRSGGYTKYIIAGVVRCAAGGDGGVPFML